MLEQETPVLALYTLLPAVRQPGSRLCHLFASPTNPVLHRRTHPTTWGVSGYSTQSSTDQRLHLHSARGVMAQRSTSLRRRRRSWWGLEGRQVCHGIAHLRPPPAATPAQFRSHQVSHLPAAATLVPSVMYQKSNAEQPSRAEGAQTYRAPSHLWQLTRLPPQSCPIATTTMHTRLLTSCHNPAALSTQPLTLLTAASAATTSRKARRVRRARKSSTRWQYSRL